MPKKKSESLGVILDREAAFNALKSKYPNIDIPLSIERVPQSDILPTPSVALNGLCGVDNGIRKGSIVCVYGAFGSYKTTMSLQMLKQAQDKWPDKAVAFIDVEHCVDGFYASNKLGINTEPFEDGTPRFVYQRPGCAEDIWEFVGTMAATGQFSIIVLDSITAMRAKAVVENGSFDTGQIGLDARITSFALKKYEPIIMNTGTILWITSQERNLQIQPFVVKGPSGGQSLPFYMTHMFKIDYVERKRKDGDIESPERKIKVFSNKMKWARPYKEVEVPVILGKGIDVEGDIIECSIAEGILSKAGSWIQMGKEKVQGVENAKTYLENNPEEKEKLLSELNSLREAG